MTDLIHVLPDFDTGRYSHILPSLEKALVTTNDLLSLDALEIAKRAHIPLVETQKLASALTESLHASIHQRYKAGQKASYPDDLHGKLAWATITTLDAQLDSLLNGGFPVGQLTEVVGESAAGKTQLLLTLLLSVQLPAPYGLSRTALYLSTEGPLQTSRLAQILDDNPSLAQFADSELPTLSRIQSVKVDDLDEQDHVLRYQVPVAIIRSNIGLIVIDSIAANFRAEFERGSSTDKDKSRIQGLAERSRQLIQTGSWLRQLAREHNVAIVVANQVLDRIGDAGRYSSQSASQPDSSLDDSVNQSQTVKGQQQLDGTEDPDPPAHRSTLSTNDPLALDHQQRFFTGWGDIPTAAHATDLKTPSLGLTWTNQLSARITLLKQPVYDPRTRDLTGWRRTFKLAFASWCADGNGIEGTAFEIWKGGLRSLTE